MAPEYDAQKDGLESYNVWIASQRAKLLQERCPAAKRVEVIGQCELYLGDCRNILPKLERIDAVVTDPPYGISLNTNNSRFSGGASESVAKRGAGKKYDTPIIGDDQEFDPSHLLVAPIVVIWGWNNFPDALPRGTGLVWLKRNDDAFGSFLSDAELGWMNKGHGVYCFRDLSNAGITKERVHPTQKPVPLMEWTLAKSGANGVICDPYMGSGSTGVACIKRGLRFVGIEMHEPYFNAACERIRKAYAQPDMFVSAPKPEEQKQEAFL